MESYQWFVDVVMIAERLPESSTCDIEIEIDLKNKIRLTELQGTL